MSNYPAVTNTKEDCVFLRRETEQLHEKIGGANARNEIKRKKYHPANTCNVLILCIQHSSNKL